MTTRIPRLLPSMLFAAASVIPIGPLHAADGANETSPRAPLFTSAPAPETLAELLFPPRYRNAAEAADTGTPASGFGMRIRFRFDSTDVLPESEPMLRSVGEMLGMESVAARSIVVEGHTDVLGSEAYNQSLSERRARSIKHYLVEHFGVAPKRLITLGKGERELAAASDPKSAINRRVTFRPARKVFLK